MKIGWLSDIHFGQDGDPFLGKDLDAALDFLLSKYGYVVLSGDITHYGCNVAMLHAVAGIIKDKEKEHGQGRIKILPGNHDSQWLRHTPNGERANDFRKSAWQILFDGEHYTSPVVNDEAQIHFLSLNTYTDNELKGNPDGVGTSYHLTQPDLQRIEAIAQDSVKTLPLVFFTHIPLVEAGYSAGQYDNWAMALNILNQMGRSVHVCSGHLHGRRVITQNQVSQTVVGPFGLDHTGSSTRKRQMAVIDVSYGRVEVTFPGPFNGPR